MVTMETSQFCPNFPSKYFFVVLRIVKRLFGVISKMVCVNLDTDINNLNITFGQKRMDRYRKKKKKKKTARKVMLKKQIAMVKKPVLSCMKIVSIVLVHYPTKYEDHRCIFFLKKST